MKTLFHYGQGHEKQVKVMLLCNETKSSFRLASRRISKHAAKGMYPFATGAGELTQDRAARSHATVPAYGPGRLYWFEEAPPQLQFNKYIRSGYRAGENKEESYWLFLALPCCISFD
jgi:hypothetical protein